MTLDALIMAFGAFVAVLPFLQLPQNWVDFLAFLAGIVIVVLGIVVRRRTARAAPEQSRLFQAEEAPENR